jgi:hypothetical protein
VATEAIKRQASSINLPDPLSNLAWDVSHYCVDEAVICRLALNCIVSIGYVLQKVPFEMFILQSPSRG